MAQIGKIYGYKYYGCIGRRPFEGYHYKIWVKFKEHDRLFQDRYSRRVLGKESKSRGGAGIARETCERPSILFWTGDIGSESNLRNERRGMK